MIEVIPAIDIIGGECVRLHQGDYQEKTVYYKNPVDFAKKIAAVGIKKLHLVDLDGAKAGEVKNLKLLTEIKITTGLEIDFGGGIKTLQSAWDVINAGAEKINLGSIAVKNPELTAEIITALGPEKIIMAADVKDRFIAINAWQDKSSLELNTFIKQYLALGVNQFLCTDVSKDGTLAGPALELYQEIISDFPEIYLIASGGVADYTDLTQLDHAKVSAVVVGKAILEGRISLEQIC